MPVRVVLADDHRLVRAGLRLLVESLPEVRVVGEADDGEAALRIARDLEPDLVLLDVHMPRLNGLDVLERLRVEAPRSRVVMLSMSANEEVVLRALDGGASGYLLKDVEPDELQRAIAAVMRGETYLSGRIAGLVTGYLRSLDRPLSPLEQLTGRQREVLQLVAEGHSSKAIAALLGISAKTVEHHRGQIMDLLDIHDLAGLVRFAIRHGLIRDDG